MATALALILGILALAGWCKAAGYRVTAIRRGVELEEMQASRDAANRIIGRQSDELRAIHEIWRDGKMLWESPGGSVKAIGIPGAQFAEDIQRAMGRQGRARVEVPEVFRKAFGEVE